MTRPGDGGSSGPPAGDSPGSQSNTYEAHGHCWWPQGDPDRLDRAAAAWEAAAKGIQRVAGDGDTAVRSVTSHNSGDAIDKFGAFWSKYYSGGSDTATLTQSADACLQIAHVCREHADGIRRARKEVIALAVAAAATVAVGLVLTFVSFGASDVAAEGAAAAITAEALALEETFSTLLMGVIRTALMGALKGAAFSMAYDAIIVQPIEMHFEPGRHFSIDEVGEWGLAGAAVGGTVEGGLASVRAFRIARAARMLRLAEESGTEADDALETAADALPENESGLPEAEGSPSGDAASGSDDEPLADAGGGSTEGEGAPPWTSAVSQLEADVANEIEKAMPGRVEGVSVDVYRADGSKLTDYDVEGDDFVIEVSGGKGGGKSTQLEKIAGSTVKRVAVYGPKLGPHVTRAIEQQGIPVFRNFEDLMRWLGQGWGG